MSERYICAKCGSPTEGHTTRECALGSEVLRLRARLDGLDRFSPTPEQVNTLPLNLRRYIHQLETDSDPAGDQAALVHALETINALLQVKAELEAEVGQLRENLKGNR
jgi:hypothetical protein